MISVDSCVSFDWRKAQYEKSELHSDLRLLSHLVHEFSIRLDLRWWLPNFNRTSTGTGYIQALEEIFLQTQNPVPASTLSKSVNDFRLYRFTARKLRINRRFTICLYGEHCKSRKLFVDPPTRRKQWTHHITRQLLCDLQLRLSSDVHYSQFTRTRRIPGMYATFPLEPTNALAEQFIRKRERQVEYSILKYSDTAAEPRMQNIRTFNFYRGQYHRLSLNEARQPRKDPQSEHCSK